MTSAHRATFSSIESESNKLVIYPKQWHYTANSFLYSYYPGILQNPMHWTEKQIAKHSSISEFNKKNSNPLKVYGTDLKLWNLPDAAKVKDASNNLNTGSGIQKSSFSRNLTVWKFALLLTHPQSLQSVQLAMDLEKVKTSKDKFYSINSPAFQHHCSAVWELFADANN